MKYLVVAILNFLYGALLLIFTPPSTPGFITAMIVSLVLITLGVIGLICWIRVKFLDAPELIAKSWFNLVKGFDILLVLGLLFKAFILQPFVVDGSSMEKNFHNNEILLVDKISHHLREPKRDEVVIFKAPQNPKEDYIKRIIGLPGEEVKITNGKVYINNQLLNEPYLSGDLLTETSSNNTFIKTLGPDEYFVMGDNRDNSSDSREWGILPKKNLIGRAWIIIYPWNEMEVVPKF